MITEKIFREIIKEILEEELVYIPGYGRLEASQVENKIDKLIQDLPRLYQELGPRHDHVMTRVRLLQSFLDALQEFQKNHLSESRYHEQIGYNDRVMLRPEAVRALNRMSDYESEPYMEGEEIDLREDLMSQWQLMDDVDERGGGYSAEDKLDSLLGIALKERIDGRVVNVYTRPGRGKRIDVVYGLGRSIEYQGVPAEVTAVLRDVPYHIFATVPHHVR